MASSSSNTAARRRPTPRRLSHSLAHSNLKEGDRYRSLICASTPLASAKESPYLVCHGGRRRGGRKGGEMPYQRRGCCAPGVPGSCVPAPPAIAEGSTHQHSTGRRMQPSGPASHKAWPSPAQLSPKSTHTVQSAHLCKCTQLYRSVPPPLTPKSQPPPTCDPLSCASMSAAEMRDRHSWGRQKRECTATLRA